MAETRISEWQALAVRCTAFIKTPFSPEEVKRIGWWKTLTSRDPDIEQSRLKNLERTVAGSFENGQLILNISLGRVDWIMKAQAENEDGDAGFSVLGLFENVNKTFLNHMQSWLKDQGHLEISRLAFSAQIVNFVSDKISGYTKLGELLPNIKIDPESADFLYRINKPRDSKVISGLKINRLTQWVVVSYRGFAFSVDLRTEQTQQISSGEEKFGCVLDLDINTAPTESLIPKDRLPLLLKELMEMGQEIAEKGDE